MSSQFVSLQQCNYPYPLTDVTIGFQSHNYTGVEGGVVHVDVAVIEGKLARSILVNIRSQDESKLLYNHKSTDSLSHKQGSGFLVLRTSLVIKLAGLVASLEF